MLLYIYQSYEFNLANTGDIDLVYQVVVKIDENSFEDEIINIDTDSLNDNAEISSVQDNTILYTGKLLKKQSVNYSGLIAYINERADKKDLDGKSIKFHLEANAIPSFDTYNKTTNKNIENIGKAINNLQLAMQSGQISFPQTQLDNGNPVVMALVVNSEGLTPYASGCVEINGQDYSTGGGHSRLLHYLENAGLSDIKLETNDNYKFYTIFFFADGSFRIGCGANDDSSEYREDTFENHSKWWKSAPQSMIEKELYS